jgi:hypothetical protein
MKHVLLAAALMFPLSANAQTTSNLAFTTPSKAEQEMQAEIAKHPGQHWVCTGMDWYCLEGYWAADPSPQAQQVDQDWKINGELGAMYAADKAEEERKKRETEAAPFRAAAEFPSTLEHRFTDSPVVVTGTSSILVSRGTSAFIWSSEPAATTTWIYQNQDALARGPAALEAKSLNHQEPIKYPPGYPNGLVVEGVADPPVTSIDGGGSVTLTPADLTPNKITPENWASDPRASIIAVSNNFDILEQRIKALEAEVALLKQHAAH